MPILGSHQTNHYFIASRQTCGMMQHNIKSFLSVIGELSAAFGPIYRTQHYTTLNGVQITQNETIYYLSSLLPGQGDSGLFAVVFYDHCDIITSRTCVVETDTWGPYIVLNSNVHQFNQSQQITRIRVLLYLGIWISLHAFTLRYVIM